MSRQLISKKVKNDFKKLTQQLVSDLSQPLVIVQESNMFVDCPNDIWDSINKKSSNVFDASFVTPVTIFVGTDQQRTINPIPFTAGRCPVCFETGTLVETKDGFKEIEQFKINDKVNDGDCIEQKVNKIFIREGEFQFTYINTWGNSIGIEATSNHPFKVYDNLGGLYKPILGKVSKKSIDKVKKGDIVCKTIRQLPLQSLETFNFSWKKIINFPKNLSETIEITDELLFNIGMYIAEGHTSRNRTVGYTLNKDKETELGHKICKFWCEFTNSNYNVYFKNGVNAASFEIYSASLSNFFDRLCGHGATYKKIPDEFYYKLDRRQTLVLLFGIFAGDGYYRDRDGEIVLDTISRILAYQVYNLLLSCGFTVSIWSQEERIDKDGVFHNKSYYLSYFSSTDYIKRGRILTNSTLYSVVKTVQHKIKDTKVYNLEVNNNHSYTANGYFVYNCLGEGQLFTSKEICIPAMVNFISPTSSRSGKFFDLPAGKEGVNFIIVKTIACNYELLLNNQIFVIHGNTKCEKFRPPILRGLGGEEAVVEMILQTTEIGERTSGKFGGGNQFDRDDDPRRRIKGPTDLPILRGDFIGRNK